MAHRPERYRAGSLTVAVMAVPDDPGGPIVSDTWVTSQKAVNTFQAFCLDQGWVFTETPEQTDFGKDGYLDFSKDGRLRPVHRPPGQRRSEFPQTGQLRHPSRPATAYVLEGVQCPGVRHRVGPRRRWPLLDRSDRNPSQRRLGRDTPDPRHESHRHRGPRRLPRRDVAIDDWAIGRPPSGQTTPTYRKLQRMTVSASGEPTQHTSFYCAESCSGSIQPRSTRRSRLSITARTTAITPTGRTG